MPEWQRLFEMPQLAILLGVVFGCVIPIVALVTSYWCKAQKVRYENELKRMMIDRGHSVDEIERLLAAEGPQPLDSRG